MEKENKKRLIGLLTSPITGNLSKKVKENIFGLQYQYSCLELHVYEGLHWTGKLASGISVLTNVLTPLAVSFYLQNIGYNDYSCIPIPFALYNFAVEGTLSLLNDFERGSSIGNIISKYFIEPKLPEEKDEENE